MRAVGAVGWSAGGRIALALAARHPDLVRSAALAGTPAPDEEVPWVPDEYRAALDALPLAAWANVLAAVAVAPS